MARLTRFSAVLISIFALAAQAYPADTSMLYVKSLPSGASVVIDGKERGKTPVLVRGLPAGDVTVELRIAGVKPVTKQATVEANKVVTIDVAIEVPSSSLTIVSEPLEATVILDGRDVGKTPLTLEHIQPGEHSLILLKDGHPRTARLVVLEPGSERVLEVKLGTPGGDETARPAPGKEAAKAQGPGRVPVEVQLILTMLKEAVDKGEYTETRRNLALALKQPDMADFKKELRAAIGVVQALEAREDAIRDGADALVGKEVVLKTRTGARKGRVEDVSVEGITMVLKIIVGGRAAGESRGVVKWSAPAPEEQDRLAASWKPEGPDGAVARAMLALARKDKAGAERAAREAGEHLLGKYLARKGEAPGDEAAERAARSAWSKIKRVRPSSVAGARKLSKEIADFEEKYGRTWFGASVEKKLAVLKRHASRISGLASGLAAHWTFDEARGAVARDSSGYGNHGRIRGARWVKGRIGAALDFDGSDDYVDCGSPATLNTTDSIAIAVWVRPDSFKGPNGSYTGLVSHGKTRDVIRSLSLKSDGTANRKPVFEIQDGKGDCTPAESGALALGVWHHLAGVVDRRVIRLYLNGSLIASCGFPGTKAGSAVHALTIGKDQWAPERARLFDGTIDDVRIYNRALSAEEVEALAAQAE